MKFSSVTAAGAAFGLAAATPIQKRSSIHKRQVPQEQSHGFILSIADEFMKLENTLNIQDAVFGLLGNDAAEEGAGDVTDFDCLKQETADQAFTNAKAVSDIRGMAGAVLFQAIERNTGSVGLASVLCEQPTVNPEIGAITSHQDAASDNALAINKAITLEAARQLASFGADPNLALLSGTFPPGDVNDATGAGFTCDDIDLELGCIYTEGLLVLDATEEEIASAVADVEQTFTGTGGIFATDLVNLADFDVAVVDEEFDLAEIAPGSNGAAVTDDVDVVEETPTLAGDVVADVTGECSLVTVTVGADQTSAVISQYPSAVITSVETPTEGVVSSTPTEIVEDDVQEDVVDDVQDNVEDVEDVVDDNNQDQDQDVVDDNQDEDNAVDGGNLQAFSGNLGGAPPPVVNNGDADRPFEVNGAAFDNEAAALIRSCDIQNNQCFNAINGGELDADTAECGDQLAECQAQAGSIARRRAKRSNILGGVNNSLLGAGGKAQVVGGANRVVVGGNRQLIGGANRVVVGGNRQLIGGANRVVVGGNKQLIGGGNLLGGGNLGALLGGGIVGGIGGGLGQVIPPSVGNQQLVSVVLQQCK